MCLYILPYRAGALVSASLPQPLTTVSDNSDMYVYFSMTENQLLALSREYGSMDEALKNMPQAELRLNDNSLYGEKGTIESISGVIDRQTGTVVARVVFPNESRLLHSGASGTVVVPSVYKDCIVIPQGATVQMQDKTVVYKVVDGKAVSTLIAVADINDGREYVVLDGLKVGDEISINILTLFALVLAIGTVVDDAIVVVEAVQSKFDVGYTSSYKATKDAMGDVTMAIVSCTCVFMAVFIPVRSGTLCARGRLRLHLRTGNFLRSGDSAPQGLERAEGQRTHVGCSDSPPERAVLSDKGCTDIQLPAGYDSRLRYG